MDKEKSVTKIIDEVIEEICNKYCKYPDIWEAEEHDDIDLSESEICENCPLNRLV